MKVRDAGPPAATNRWGGGSASRMAVLKQHQLQQQVQREQRGDRLGERVGSAAVHGGNLSPVGSCREAGRPGILPVMIGIQQRRPGQPTVVFLHGAGISSWMWRRQLTALPELDAVALDLPGHGVSAALPWDGLAGATPMVADWIRANATGGRAHVVGLSLGGVMGLDLAARYPDVVTRLVTSGALAVGLPGAELLGWMMEATMPLARIPWLVRMSGRVLGLSAEDQKELLADVERLPPSLVRQAVRDVASFRITPALIASPVPALVVAGTREYRGIRRSVAQLDDVWPQATGRLVPKASHVWNLELPDRFSEMLRSWLIEHRAPEFTVPPDHLRRPTTQSHPAGRQPG